MDEIGKKEIRLISHQYIAKWLRRLRRDMIVAIKEKRRFHPNDPTIDELERIAKLIEDTHAYDERVDEIVEHYRRQDSESSGVDEEIMAWLDNEYVSMGHALGMLLVPTDGEHFTDSELASKANLEWGQEVIKRIKKLLSQKRVVTRAWFDRLAWGVLTTTEKMQMLTEIGVEVKE
jgi:hypothetical protein